MGQGLGATRIKSAVTVAVTGTSCAIAVGGVGAAAAIAIIRGIGMNIRRRDIDALKQIKPQPQSLCRRLGLLTQLAQRGSCCAALRGAERGRRQLPVKIADRQAGLLQLTD